MKQIVGEVTAAIEFDLKPGLKNTSEHKGFCTALAAVNERLGIEAVALVPSPEDSRGGIGPQYRAALVETLGALEFSEPEINDIIEAIERARGVIGRFDQEIEPPGGGG